MGKVIHVDNIPLTIVGVTPEAFQNLRVDYAPDAAVPIGVQNANISRRMAMIVGRLKPGITIEQARAQILTMWPSILQSVVPAGFDAAQRHRFLSRRLYLDNASTGFSFFRRQMNRQLAVLMCLVATLLLIACANLGLLMLARAARRRNEIGIRIAIGAGRPRLIRHFLIESVIVSFAGAALALACSIRTGRFLVRLIWTGFTPPNINISPDIRVLGFAILLALFTGILYGIAPAIRSSRIDPASALQQTSRVSRGGGAGIRRVLVTAQIALSLVLVFGAGLFIRTLGNLRNADTGYRRDSLLIMELFPQPGRERIANRVVYYRELLDQLDRLPGVTGAAYSYYGPASPVEFREAVSSAGAASPPVDSVEGMIGPGFFHLMGMRILSGRDFTWKDDEHSPKLVVISETLARRLFGEQNPLGRIISMANRPELNDAQIIGVVSDASLWRVDSHHPPAVYAAMLQNSAYTYPLLDIRTAGDPLRLAKPAAAILESLGHHYSVRTQSLTQRLDMVLADERMLALLSGFFGVLALVLAGIGLYGLFSEAVSSRTAEIGIRMAVGAQRGEVLRMFLIDSSRLVAIGLTIGFAVALAASRLIASMLFGVSPLGVSSVAIPAAVLALAALLATYFPARRASKIDPTAALRAE